MFSFAKNRIGGKRNVVSEIVGTSLVSYLTKPEAGGEMDTIITAKPEGTIQMVYTVKDVKSGVELIQHMNKDQWFRPAQWDTSFWVIGQIKVTFRENIQDPYKYKNLSTINLIKFYQ